ncbi:MAG TPA: hypothetical protein VNO54_00965 [Streptosporangiaceae bacterium]|nr:hypothetical protein [Streptosporangiaceae bacterium]
MADWWPFDRSWVDEWRRSVAGMLSASSAAAASLGLPQPGTLPGDPFGMLVDAARTWLTGKKRTFRFADGDVTMVLTDISVQGSDLAKFVGQYGQARILARDVEWGGYQFEWMEIQVKNVHLRPGTRPVLVAAPVLCEGFMPAAAASRWLATISPQLELVLRDGVPQVGVIGAPWARLEVEAGAEGRSVHIRPRALQLGDLRLSLWSPTFSVPVPELPGGVMLTSVEPVAGGFVMRGMISEWQRSLSREGVERLLAGMRAGNDRLDL